MYICISMNIYNSKVGLSLLYFLPGDFVCGEDLCLIVESCPCSLAL